MNYPATAPINWQLLSEDSLKALDDKQQPLTQVPTSEVENLLASGNAKQFAVELVHNPTATAGQCCLYQKVGGIWACVKRC
jgi:hypothetical protein